MILLMGIQGSGKGTQAALVAMAHGYELLTLGDLIRAQATDEQRQRMLAGELLSDDEAAAIIKGAVANMPEGTQYIMDGFPRSIPQAEWLLSQAAADPRFHIDHVIHLTATRAAVKARLLNRGRADDNESSIEKRFDEYERATDPLFAWFEDHGIKVTDVDAERSVEAVNVDLVNNINNK